MRTWILAAIAAVVFTAGAASAQVGGPGLGRCLQGNNPFGVSIQECVSEFRQCIQLDPSAHGKCLGVFRLCMDDLVCACDKALCDL